MIARIVTLLLLFGSFSRVTSAATVTAASCSQTAVQAAIDSATDGSIVSVPAGSCTWSAPVTIDNKNITLQGAGHGCDSVLTPNGHSPSACTGTSTNITVTSPTAVDVYDDSKPFRVTAFRFNRSNLDDATIWVNKHSSYLSDKNATGWRIDHVYFNGNARHVSVNGARNFGVVDHSLFYVPNGTQIILFWARGANEADGTSTLSQLSGNVAHSDPISLGSADAFYVEDSEFYTNVWQGSQNISDGTAGQRVVYRHNVVRGPMIENHGACSGRARGSYTFEIYDNDIYPYDWNGTSGYQWSSVRLRGGTGVIYNNRFYGTWDSGAGEIFFDNQRSEPSTVSGGECGAPVNSVCSASSGIDTSISGRSAPLCLDQIGAGSGAIGAQAASPTYVWNNVNKGSGSANNAVTPRVDATANDSTFIQADRDFLSSQKPGYTAYAYPHPLTSGSQTTLPPTAPTNVHIK